MTSGYRQQVPELSLCIATLNRARYLSETLECLLPQLNSDIEIVILDGGSSDRTPEVVERFRQRFPQLKYERRAEAGGIDRDFDDAVGLASGDYCWLMSDDDLLEPGTLQKVLVQIRQGTPSVVVVNAAIYNADFSELLHERMLRVAEDRAYGLEDNERFFIDAARYLSYIGAVIVRRELWQSRARAPYFGSYFIHLGVLFQAPLTRAFVIAEPLVKIRYGNASWSARAFEIWMFKWPELIWSFNRFSSEARRAISPREPWKSVKTLLLYRAKGSYTLRDYRVWIRPQRASAMRFIALGVALMPGLLTNSAVTWATKVLFPRAGESLIDLQNSHYNVIHWLRNRRSGT
jgi:abequosyltransferase